MLLFPLIIDNQQLYGKILFQAYIAAQLESIYRVLGLIH